jgi:hypothetical protein
LDPGFTGSNLAKNDGFLRAMKTSSMTFFGRKVKLLVPCCKIYSMLKNAMSMKVILHRQNSLAVFCQVSPASVLDVSAGNCQRGLVDESGMIRKQMGMCNKSAVVMAQGSPCVPTPKQ